MIEHVVLFRFKADTPAEQIAQMQEAIHSLKGKVPTLRYIQFGPNLSDRSAGYSHVLVSRFDSLADVDAYIDHPDHVAVVRDIVKPWVESLAVADVDCPERGATPTVQVKRRSRQ